MASPSLGYRDMGPLRETPWRYEGEFGGERRSCAIAVQMLVALPKSVLDPEVRKVVAARPPRSP